MLHQHPSESCSASDPRAQQDLAPSHGSWRQVACSRLGMGDTGMGDTGMGDTRMSPLAPDWCFEAGETLVRSASEPWGQPWMGGVTNPLQCPQGLQDMGGLCPAPPLGHPTSRGHTCQKMHPHQEGCAFVPLRGTLNCPQPGEVPCVDPA